MHLEISALLNFKIVFKKFQNDTTKTYSEQNVLKQYKDRALLFDCIAGAEIVLAFMLLFWMVGWLIDQSVSCFIGHSEW